MMVSSICSRSLRFVQWGVVGIASFIGVSQSAFGWGQTAHQIIATTGSQLPADGNAFWAANAHSMGMLTKVPDIKWKSGPSATGEKPTHWFQPDAYFDNASLFINFPHQYAAAVSQYTEAMIVKNGTAPWRVGQFYDLTVSAIKGGDFVTALQMAGVMSHYIGDLSQPLHVSKNYDGEDTGDSGIHKFFETDNISAANFDNLSSEVQSQAQALLNDPNFTNNFSGSVVDVAFSEANRAFAEKDNVINTDLQQGRSGAGSDALLKIAESRMADGAATLSIILARLWQEAGNSNYGASVSASTPTWVAPNFDGSQVTNRLSSVNVASVSDRVSDYLAQDDCN